MPDADASPFWALDQGGRASALHHAGRTVSHDELAARANAAAAGLQAGEVFALECAPTLVCVSLYLGALRCGAVPLMVDAGLDADSRQRLVRHYRIARAFDGASGQWRDTGAAAAGTVRAHPTLGLLLSTSGSTGSPKLVRLSRANLQANARSICQALALGPQDVAITTLPLHYSYGLSVLNSHLACGAQVVLTDQPVTSAPFWQAVAAHRVTSLSGVPTLWRLLRRLRFERMALPSVRSFTQAGGRLDIDEVQALHAIAEQSGRRLFVMYGQTEATARIACLPPHLLPAKAGSIGTAIPGGRLWLVDGDGLPVTTPGQTGELVYEGPNVMLGYAERPEDLALGPGSSTLHTGDLAHQDTDGCFWITGRLKRLIKLFGHRLSLDEVEQWLRQQGLDAAVTGRDDRLMVAIADADVDADAGAALAEAWRQRLAQHLRAHHSAVQVRSLPALPLGGNGKPLYAALQAWMDDPTTPAPASAPVLNAALETSHAA